MLAGFDGVAKVLRTEVGRCGQHDDIDVVGDVLEVVEAAETHFGNHVDAVTDTGLLQCRQLVLQPIPENISHRDQAGVRVRRQGVDGCSATATATADQPDLQGVGGAGRVDPAVKRGSQRTTQCGGGCFQSVAS